MKLGGSCLGFLARGRLEEENTKDFHGVRDVFPVCSDAQPICIHIRMPKDVPITRHLLPLYILWIYLFSFCAKMALILAQTNLGLWAASTGFQIPVFL
jgi:hypothetical protein